MNSLIPILTPRALRPGIRTNDVWIAVRQTHIGELFVYITFEIVHVFKRHLIKFYVCVPFARYHFRKRVRAGPKYFIVAILKIEASYRTLKLHHTKENSFLRSQY